MAVDKIPCPDYNKHIHRRAFAPVKKRPVSFPEAGCFVGYMGEWRIYMFIVYFALWVILNGKWTTEIGIFGVIFAAALYAFSCRFMGYGFKKDLHYLRRLPTTICYGATLLAEIFKANVTVMKMILDKNFEPQPQLVHFESGLKETRHRVVLADSITLTPARSPASWRATIIWCTASTRRWWTDWTTASLWKSSLKWSRSRNLWPIP